MPRSKEIQEQMRNKIVDMYQSGKGYKVTSKALGLHANHGQSHYPQMEKTCNSGEPSREWLAYQNYSKSAVNVQLGAPSKVLQTMNGGC